MKVSGLYEIVMASPPDMGRWQACDLRKAAGFRGRQQLVAR
jgi:hypothetical protein